MTSSPQPLFYTDLFALNSNQHADWVLKAPRTLAFARKTNVVPLTMAEFPAAAPSYPIVFGGGEAPIALMVVGLTQGENLFVSASGAWAEGHYVPAYVRRYPFMLVAPTSEAKDFVLAAQQDPGCIGSGEGVALFTDGKPSEVVQHALGFCQAFKQQSDITADFTRALIDHDLLVDRHVVVTAPDGSKRTVNGFRVIDAERLAALPDATFLDWRRRGWLPAVYAHLQSLDRWGVMVTRIEGPAS